MKSAMFTEIKTTINPSRRNTLQKCLSAVAISTGIVPIASNPRNALAQAMPAVTTHLPNAKLVGQARLRVLILIYDAGLYAPAGFNAANPYATPIALEVNPARAFRSTTVVSRLETELQRQKNLSETQVAKYVAAFSAVMPAMEENVPLTGVYQPKQGWTLFHKGVAIGKWADDTFARAFFDIWLGADTSQPAVRQSLMNSAIS